MRGNAGHRMSPTLQFWLFERAAKSAIGSWLFTIQITDKRALRRFRIHQQYNQRRQSTRDQIAMLSSAREKRDGRSRRRRRRDEQAAEELHNYAVTLHLQSTFELFVFRVNSLCFPPPKTPPPQSSTILF